MCVCVCVLVRVCTLVCGSPLLCFSTCYHVESSDCTTPEVLVCKSAGACAVRTNESDTIATRTFPSLVSRVALSFVLLLYTPRRLGFVPRSGEQGLRAYASPCNLKMLSRCVLVSDTCMLCAVASRLTTGTAAARRRKTA